MMDFLFDKKRGILLKEKISETEDFVCSVLFRISKQDN